MKKNKKDGMIIINPILTFKRYLKEHGMYAAYLKYVTPKEGIYQHLKNINPETYFHSQWINREKASKNVGSWTIISYFNRYEQSWRNYIKYEVNKEHYIEMFKIFLKKRGILDLYQSCFAPYYVNRLMSMSGNKKCSPLKEVNRWEDLYPNHFIESAFDHKETIKSEHFWERLDEKWQKELRIDQMRIKYKI